MSHLPRGRWLWFALLYFSEGAPIGWIWWTLPTQLARRGLPVDEIGTLTSTLALVWTLKFTWAPLVDLLHPRLSLRAWIGIAQLGMAATLLALLAIDPAVEFGTLFALLLAHAFFAATQDVAIDALAIRTTPPAQQGRLNGAMQTGMIAGRLLFSSGVLFLGLGHRATVAALGSTVLAIAATVAWLPRDAARPAPARVRRNGHLRRWLGAALRSGRLRWLALFAAVGGAGFEAAGALSGSWFVARKLDDDAIGVLRLAAAVAMAVGALLGGAIADRTGTRRTVAAFVLGTAALGLAIALADQLGARAVALAAFVALYLALGGLTAASYALFMQHARGPMRATLFSAMMGATNFCESWAGRLAAELAATAGYPVAMATPALLSLLGLVALARVGATAPELRAGAAP